MKNLLFKVILFLFWYLFSQTDVQIKQAKEIFKKSGLTEQQAKTIAKQRGYSDKQINNAIKRSDDIEKIKNQGDIITEKVISVDNGNSNNKYHNEAKDLTLQPELEFIDDPKLDVISKENKFQNIKNNNSGSFFGYDIFKRDPSLFQASSVGAVDPNYLIGPGDEIILMLWGETQFRQVITVDREGFVFIPEIGQVFVNGLNLALLESKLFRVMSQSYASLNPAGRKPTTFLDISLGNLRPLRIQVVGEVMQPGAYTVSPNATLFSALYYFNGPTTLGTLRDIRLIRNGEEISKIDFYDYLLTGKKVRDQKLQLDDVIFIPKRLKTVTILGEINRPGIYEIKQGETLEDLISFAGDLKITAYLDRAQVDRVLPFDEREKSGMDRMFVDIDLRKAFQANKQFNLKENDKIQVFSVREVRQNVVTISGAVSRPGGYDLGDFLTLGDLIKKADGLLGSAYLKRADVTRIRSDYSEELIKINLENIINEKLENDFILHGSDHIQIFDKTEMIAQSYVSINGHVKKPGIYLLKNGMNLYDLIFTAGGFFDEEFRNKTYLDRSEIIRAMSNDNGRKKIIPFNLGELLKQENASMTSLKANDEIKVYSLEEIKGKKRYVSIKGHVKRPGIYELYEGNMTLNDLLFKAGGFEDPNHKAGAFLERADLVRLEEDRINKMVIPFNLREVLDGNSEKNFKLLSGDHINIYALNVFNTSHKVKIDGVIRKPGFYDLKRGMTIKDLILEAGGVSENVFIYKIDIARISNNLSKNETFSESIELDMLNDYSVSNIQYDESLSIKIDTNSNEFLLKPYDFISVRTDLLFKAQREVTIVGEVFYPGVYIIKNPYERITDILSRAGGLRPNAYPFGSSFLRDNNQINIDLEKIIKKPNQEINIPIRDGDKIIIVKRPEVYQVKGEVSSPGFYKYRKNLRLNDVIKDAGGFTKEAEKDEIFIAYPNGISKKYRKYFGNHKVKDGSTVTIGTQKESEDFDKTEYAKELTGIIANLAQALSLYLIAKN